MKILRCLPLNDVARKALIVVVCIGLVFGSFTAFHLANAATLLKGDVNRAASGGIVIDADLHSKAPTFNTTTTTRSYTDSETGETVAEYSVALDVAAESWTKLDKTVTATWKNVGFDGDDDRIDIVVTWMPNSRWYSKGKLTKVPILQRFTENGYNTAGICLVAENTTAKTCSEQHIKYNFYKTGTTTAAKGSFLTKISDLDRTGWYEDYSDRWCESVELISGYHDIYIPSTNVLNIGENRNNDPNTDFRATKKMDGSSLNSGFTTNLNNGAQFWYYGTYGATDILDQFSPKTITLSSGSNGKAHCKNLSNKIAVGWRGSRTISIEPNTGYKVDDVLVDSNSVGAKTSYPFTNVTSNHTLKATFTPITYKMKFNANGGSGTMSQETMTYDTAKALTANAFTKTGYTFKNWNTATGGTGTTYTNKQSVKNLSSTDGAVINLYAQWSANTYKVAFNANSGSGSMSTQTHTYDTAAKLTKNTFTRTGYTWSGWNTKADGSGTSYTNEQSVKNLSATQDATVTLYAQWTPISFNVTFDRNGGTGEMKNQAFTYDQAKTLSANEFTRTGYDFLNWNTQASGKGTTYTNKQSVKNLSSTAGASFPLYAQWSPHHFTIVYNANTGKGTMENQALAYDTPAALHANAFTKKGYTWKSWNAAADGSKTSYSNKQVVTNLTPEDGKAVTLYAQWQANGYRIAYDPNTGTGTMEEQNATFDKTLDLTPNAFSKTGYTFTGWNTAKDGSGTAYRDQQEVLNLTETNGATVMLYAQWRANAYTIAFDAAGGSGTMEDQAATFDTRLALNANQFKRTGYTFQGWSKEKGGAISFLDKSEVLNLTSEPNGRVTLYAVWEENAPVNFSYAVSDPLHAKVSLDSEDVPPATGTAKGSTVEVNPGYHFGSWVNSKNKYACGDETIVPQKGDDGLYAPDNFVAVIAPIGYDVAFDRNGGTGKMANQPFTYDETQALTPCSFTRTGYIFDAWSTGARSVEGTYADNQAVRNLTDQDGATVNLLAMWHPISYTLDFAGNGGEGEMPTENLTYDEKKNLPDNKFDRPGYTFTGWNSEPDGSGTDYADGAEVENLTSVDGDKLVVYAQWEINHYTVRFVDGYENELNTQQVDHGHSAYAPDDPTHEGKVFDGWDKDFSCITGDLVVTAQWKDAPAPVVEAAPVAPEPYDKTGTDDTPLKIAGIAAGTLGAAALAFGIYRLFIMRMRRKRLAKLGLHE